MVTKSTILAGLIAIGTFWFVPVPFAGPVITHLAFSAAAGIATAAITKVVAAKIFHEGETKAERKPESHRDRTIEEIRRKLEGFEEMPHDAQRELVLELCVTHSISPEIRESLLEKLKTAAYEAKAELIERVRDSLPERG